MPSYIGRFLNPSPAVRAAAYVLSLSLLSGCVTKGTPVERGLMAEGAPSPALIIADFARNDGAINTFEVTGVQFILESPRITEQILRGRSLVAFERPDKLYISAREPRTGTQVIRLAVKGDTAYLQLRTRDEYRRELWEEGEMVDDLAIPVSPREIVREAFLPEDWGGLSRSEYRLVAFDQDAQLATIDIGDKDEPRRRIVAARMGDGTWTLARALYYRDGVVAAESEMSAYRDYDGIRFPTSVKLAFIEEATELTLELTKAPVFNEQLDPEWFRFPRAEP